MKRVCAVRQIFRGRWRRAWDQFQNNPPWIFKALQIDPRFRPSSPPTLHGQYFTATFIVFYRGRFLTPFRYSDLSEFFKRGRSESFVPKALPSSRVSPPSARPPLLLTMLGFSVAAWTLIDIQMRRIRCMDGRV